MQSRIDTIVHQLERLEARLDELEGRSKIIDNYLGLMRFASPLLLGVAGLVIGILLK